MYCFKSSYSHRVTRDTGDHFCPLSPLMNLCIWWQHSTLALLFVSVVVNFIFWNPYEATRSCTTSAERSRVSTTQLGFRHQKHSQHIIKARGQSQARCCTHVIPALRSHEQWGSKVQDQLGVHREFQANLHFRSFCLKKKNTKQNKRQTRKSHRKLWRGQSEK